MSTFWSAWVIIITLICLAFVFITLYLNQLNYTGVKEGEEMGHEFDGIKELNNPLPKWWRNMYWATGIWAIFYLALYPGLGSFEGLFGGWRSSNQDIRSLAESKAAVVASQEAGIRVAYDKEVLHAEETFGPIFKAFAEKNIEQLLVDPDALEIGQRLYLQNCSQCHGSNARGGEGFPDLTDKDWLYGGEFEQIKETLMHGRKAAMPAWQASLGDQGIKDVTAYVLTLSGREAKEGSAAAGKAQFAICAACHGAEGEGSLALGLPMGAPNLTDDIWLYGGSERAIQETLAYGRNGVMPAWKDILGKDKVHLISAYVYSLSNSK